MSTEWSQWKDVEKLLIVAKIAEECDRYTDMKQAMKQLVELKNGKGISCEERNLLSMAYKNIVGGHRSAWRVLTCYAAQTKHEQNLQDKIENYIKIVVKELKECCEEVMTLIDRYLLKTNDSAAIENTNDEDTEGASGDIKEDSIEAKVFFTKMKGDYLRYQTEVIPQDDESRTSAITNAENAYEQAMKLAEELDCMSPLRLGLALNFSVFHYEILLEPEQACVVAKKAYDEAMNNVDLMTAETTKESTLILQLLRDNLTLWSNVDIKSEAPPAGE